MIGLLCVAIGLIGQWLFGMSVAQGVLALRDRSQRTLVELAGLGFAIGIGVGAWSLFQFSFCGGPLGFLPSGLLAAVGYLTGGPLLLRCLRQHQADQTQRTPLSDSERSEVAFGRACQVIILALFVACVLQTLLTPQKLWDERAIFALKARVLFEDQSIRSPSLYDPDFAQYHPRYPLLLPLAEEHIYALLGYVDDRLSKLVFSMLYCGLVLTTAGVLLRHMSSGRAWLGALVMATVPVMMPYEYGFLCGQADAPVACYHGLSLLYLWDALSSQKRGEFRPRSCVMAGLCGGLAAFTKDEGIAYLIVDTGILGLAVTGLLLKQISRVPVQVVRGSPQVVRGSPDPAPVVNGSPDPVRAFPQGSGLPTHDRVPIQKSILSMMFFIATAATIIGPWMWHRRGLPITTEMNYFGRMTVTLFGSRLGTLGWSIPHLVSRMFWEWREWGLQWWFMLSGIVARPLRAIQFPQLLFILDVAGSLASLLVAGMLAPAQLDEHIGGSSHRFLMQIAPVAVLFAVTIFADDKSRDII